MSILLQRISTGTSSMAYCLICRIQSQIELKEDLSVTEKTRKMPMAERQQEGVRVWKRYCPAVSHICTSTSLPFRLNSLQPQSSPTVLFTLRECYLLGWVKALRIEVLPTLESPTNMILTTSSDFKFIIQMQVKGKQIKDYILGEAMVSRGDMHLLTGSTVKGQEVSILMIEKNQMDQQSFLGYVNILQQNPNGIHPRYLQPIQSTNNIYVVVEKLLKLTEAPLDHLELLAALINLYRHIGEYKVEAGQLFMTLNRRVVYLPFYKNVHTSSKFYAQFHNKSVLGEVFAHKAPINKNRALEIFLQNIDSPNAMETISKLIKAESNIKSEKYPMVQKNDYPSLAQDEKDDQEILRLMSEATVNNNLKEQANALYQRNSVRQFQQSSEKQFNHIMQQAQSTMPIIKKANKSSQFRTKLDVKTSQSKLQGNQFQVYFNSYYQTLRFLKKSLRVFLAYYKNGFAGIVSSYLIAMVLTLRKAYMIKDLQCGMDIFLLDIDMVNVKVKKYVAIIAKELKTEARMVAELRVLLQNCQMPYKTYQILVPFLEEDISKIDLDQLQSFTFYFLTALMKGRQKGKTHFMYFIETMYLLLHGNYQIVFFESDFPGKWDSAYFDGKVALISAILPGWSVES